MLDTAFYFVLNMSLTACFIIAVLLLLRLIKPLPRRLIYPFWGLAFVRLTVPFSMPTHYSLFNFTGNLVKRLITIETMTQAQVPAPAGELLIMNMLGAAEQYVPVVEYSESLRPVFSTGAWVWVTIAAGLLLAVTVFYAYTRLELKKATPIGHNLYRSNRVNSPLLTGVFRPIILIPTALDPDSDTGKMVLAHENIHRRRLDNVWRMLGIGVVCLHWFNPLAWVALQAFLSDMELSCDETVIRSFSIAERKLYASALLGFAAKKQRVAGTAFVRSDARVRIINVLRYKKLTTIGLVAATIFLLVITILLITNPRG